MSLQVRGHVELLFCAWKYSILYMGWHKCIYVPLIVPPHVVLLFAVAHW